MRPVEQLPSLLLARSADVAIGTRGPPATMSPLISFLQLRGGGRRAARTTRSPVTRWRGAEVRRVMWALGPAAVGTTGRDADACCADSAYPRSTSASSRASAAAIEEAKRIRRRGPRRAVRGRRGPGRRRLSILDGPGLRAEGSWCGDGAAARTARSRSAAELIALHHHPARHAGHGAGRRGGPRPVQADHPRHALELSPPEIAASTSPAPGACGRAGTRRSTAAPPPSSRPAARSPAPRRAG